MMTMIYVIAILWLLALVLTISKRARQIRKVKTKIKESYEQRTKKNEGEEAEKSS